MSALGIWFVIWVLIGVVAGALASVVSSEEPPYGLAVDVVVAVLATVVTGLIDYYVLRAVEIGGTIAFVIMVLEPLFGAAIFLWLLRVIKRRRGK
ncbi:MAG TPA: hypothetical protein ENN19_15425 [Chloroflexi bacterium]|nr:hypothetical protein [Chloroflexota bacterium]